MNLVFFSHPSFLGSQSMPRYTTMLANGMKKRGHNVRVLMPSPRMFDLSLPQGFRKWMGYVDQFYFFPKEVRRNLRQHSPDTLYILTDHALGPWLHLIAHLPHVIHCHDFLAQQSAKGEISENPTRWSGRQYQRYIRRGYSKGKNFISVSYKTREDLHCFLQNRPSLSKVIYNGLNPVYQPLDPVLARQRFSMLNGQDLSYGYILHVGGNQWYKNRTGVVEIYNVWRSVSGSVLPLLLIGAAPSPDLQKQIDQSPFRSSIYVVQNLSDVDVHQAYAGASVFLFPSLAEGFGWPIAEAMASGCPVITTNEAPMTEVADKSAFLIPRRPADKKESVAWALHCAQVVSQVLSLPEEIRKQVVEAGFSNIKRFSMEPMLQEIETVYKSVLRQSIQW